MSKTPLSNYRRLALSLGLSVILFPMLSGCTEEEAFVADPAEPRADAPEPTADDPAMNTKQTVGNE